MKSRVNLEEVRAKQRTGMALDARERRALARYWQSGAGTIPVKRKRIVKPLIGFTCSYCGCEVSEAEATVGKNKKVACPQHALRIKRVKFTQTEG